MKNQQQAKTTATQGMPRASFGSAPKVIVSKKAAATSQGGTINHAAQRVLNRLEREVVAILRA